MLLQYKSILIISEWQELKEQKKYDEISEADFRRVREKQKLTCKEIHDKHGVVVYNIVSRKKMNELASGARQNIIAGMYNFIDVLVRLAKIDLALDICSYILCYAPKNFHQQFKRKEDWLKQIKSQKK